MEHTSAPNLSLKAPLSGVLLPIEQVPDPVFSQKMVGDGVSIDPTSQVLLAPCDGEVVQLHAAAHAVTLRCVDGIEVMMHIGLDTVDLKGEGFSPKVKVGDRVETGNPLIEFDADYIATHAKSLLTQVLVLDAEKVAELRPASGSVEAGKDQVLEVTPAVGTAAQEAVGKAVTSEAVLVPNATGLHARPAAVLANLAKKFKAEVRLRKGESEVNAKSVVAIMGLEVGQNDKLVVIARGVDAQAAIDTLVPEIRSGLGDEGTTPAPAPATTIVGADSAPPPRPRSDDPNLLLGVAASPGLGVGKVFQIRREEIKVEEEAGGDPRAEQRKLDSAIEQAVLQLEALQAKLHGQKQPAKAAIFAAHQELLDDPDLLDIAQSAIAKGKSAAFAWQRAYTTHAERLAALRNELLAGRANDLRDVGLRVLRILTGQGQQEPEIPPDTILVAEELTPSDTANLDRSRVMGFCTVGGGASSHVAILARALDIPAVAGIEPRALELENGTAAIVDGGKGRLRIHPSAEEMETIKQRKQKLAAKKAADLAAAHDPARTSDGHKVEVVANIGGKDDAEQGIELGAEGVGLLRSEFLYLQRIAAPSEEEQLDIYRGVAEVLGADRPLIIRTLDVGGDKPLPYLPIPREENPFLGERGIRIGLDRPEMLRTQMRAILRAGQGFKMRIMFPMVSTLEEIREAKGMLEQERTKLGLEPIEVGIMVEVPSTAVLAAQFAKEVDFFSIGTNDLTQYTLAIDRGHPKLASKADPMHPAVLSLIRHTVEGAHSAGKWVGVCGGIASDPQAVPILIGLGVDELSVSVPSIPAIKAEVRRYSLEQCKQLAAKAGQADTAAAVRDLVPDEDL